MIGKFWSMFMLSLKDLNFGDITIQYATPAYHIEKLQRCEGIEHMN